MYRICKIFDVECGHILSKHKEKCKNPHGHSRKIEIRITAETLDTNDMIFDFKVFKLALGEYLDSFDHAIMVNNQSPEYDFYIKHYERVIGFDNCDPTTEVMAQQIYDHIKTELAKGLTYKSTNNNAYCFNDGIVLEKVRVWETASTWAEYYE